MKNYKAQEKKKGVEQSLLKNGISVALQVTKQGQTDVNLCCAATCRVRHLKLSHQPNEVLLLSKNVVTRLCAKAIRNAPFRTHDAPMISNWQYQIAPNKLLVHNSFYF